MSARDNKWLIVRESVQLTPSIEPVIIGLDPYFEEAGIVAFVTSGKRNPEQQLAIIKHYAVRVGYDKTFPSILTATLTGKVLWEGREQVFEWQPAWSELLANGIIVNPPLQAKCLSHYKRNGIDMKGKLIDQSAHYKGGCFDVGGGGDGITNELAVIERAYAQRKIPGWLGYKIERKNNCIHCDCVVKL